MLYAIVDIETTGSYASQNSITEIAILIHDGQKIVQKFQSLFNVDQQIPPFIEALTGISNEMLVGQPYFEDLAPIIYSLIHDKIFVAHNVNFDYSFIKYQLEKCGYTLNCQKLCTVRLSRKIIPHLPSYSLGKLCHSVGISIQNRHRAMGDAEATAILFTKLLKEDDQQLIVSTLKKGSKEQILPPNLSKSELNNLPETPGVYYFKDSKGKNLYIGKAINLRKRIYSHFVGNNPSKQRQNFLKEIYHIDYQTSPTELMALILEVTEIKKYWPKFNRSLKRFEQKYSLFKYLDQKGFYRLAIDKYKINNDVIWTFNDISEGYQIIRTFVSDYNLCDKLCFAQNTNTSPESSKACNCNGACTDNEENEAYNQRLDNAIESFKETLPSYIIIDQGRNQDENSYLWIEKGKLIGMAYVSRLYDSNLDDIKDALKPLPSNPYAIQLINKFREQFPNKTIALEAGVTYKDANSFSQVNFHI